jgi:hypothetical protein
MTTDTAYTSAKSTEAFIDESPSYVSFKRTAKVHTAAGGWAGGAESTLRPQKVRLVSQSGYLVDHRLTDTGEVAVPRFVVVGMPETDMERGDVFEYGGENFRINRVNTVPPWAKRGEAIEHGTS